MMERGTRRKMSSGNGADLRRERRERCDQECVKDEPREDVKDEARKDRKISLGRN